MAPTSPQAMAPESLIAVAALFVDPRGCYAGLPGVDPWGEELDARGYDGPHPVVAHPPCSTWCQMAAVNQARYGHAIGSDGGCFAAALASVRRWGGVLEHPAYSYAWPRFELNAPPRAGGWVPASLWCGGWVCHVEQLSYGHPARKATWLYAHSVELARLLWGSGGEPRAWVGWMANHGAGEGKARVGKKAAAATPPAFRDELLAMARSARRGAR
jgi:hypothetical protein